MTARKTSRKTWLAISVITIGVILAIIQAITGNYNGIAGLLIMLVGIVLGAQSLSESSGFGCLLSGGAIVYGLWLAILAPANTTNDFIAQQMRPGITSTQLAMQAIIQPAKFDRATRGTLTVSLTNKADQPIVTENIVVSVPPKFFPVGFVIDGQSQPPYTAKSDGVEVLGTSTASSITFAGTRIPPSQTFTITIPLVPNLAGNYTGEIKVTTSMAQDSYFKGSFSAATTNVAVTVLP